MDFSRKIVPTLHPVDFFFLEKPIWYMDRKCDDLFFVNIKNNPYSLGSVLKD